MRKLLAWIDEQTGLITGIRNFAEEPLPEKVGWPHIFGSLALFFFIVQVATGILLMAYYSPSPDHAYETVQYITDTLPFGSFVRGLHHWTASAMMVALGLHLIQVFLWGAYKPPRQIIWLIGVGLLLVTFGFSFTGYLLPWDQKAYWATVVGTNIAGSVPLVGPFLRDLLRGGSGVGAVTLTRFFAIHVGILPPIIAVLIGFHVLQVRKKGITPPWTRVGEEADVPRPQLFWPHQMLRDAIAALVALAVVCLLALKFGAPIGPLANPADTAYTPRPEWYFLWLFQMLNYFPRKWEVVGAVVLPAAAVILLAAYPYLDRNPERRIRMRKYAILLCLGTFAGVSYLGVQAVLSTPKPEKLSPLEQTGQKIFMDRRCNACHGVNGGGGDAGADLGQAGPFNPEHLEALLRDPTRFQTRSIMPPADLPEPKMRALVAYLMALKPTSTLPTQPQTGPKKPESHLEPQWYINHKFDVRKDPSQCGKCHEPDFCQTCHRNHRPDSHLDHWLKFHFGTARENPAYCRVCHKDSFCASCHKTFLHTPDWLESKHAAAALKDRSMCWNCHQQVLCDTCHRGAKPASHTAGWRLRHGGVALAGTSGCMMCHREEACTTCHGLRMPHPAGWRSKHGAIAIQSPATCANCHGPGKRDTCRTCHTGQLEPSSHTPQFRKSHKEQGESQAVLCRLCHGANACDNCHKTPMPHPKDWMGTHKDHGASFAPNSFCFYCHDRAMCNKCHGAQTRD